MTNLVSIIIPCYNRSDLLRQALASCLIQTWPAIEVILVDDGSQEDLRAAIDAATIRYGNASPIVYVRQENRGGPSARNLGLKHATGAFIQYLDSDDLLHPDKIRRQIQRLLQEPRLDMVFCLDEHFRVRLGDWRALWNVPKRADCDNDLWRFLQLDTVWSTLSPLWRRQALDRIPAWDESLSYACDWQFHVAALCAGIRYEAVAEPLTYVRDHSGPRSTSMTSPKRLGDLFKAGKLAHQYLADAGLLDDPTRYLLLRYFDVHLVQASALDSSEAAYLGREMLTFMKRFPMGRTRRVALTALTLAVHTPFFRQVLSLYPARKGSGSSFGALRNIVEGTFFPPPPRELCDIVEEAGLAPCEQASFVG